MVLLPSVAFARSEYLCRFDGQARSSCCCPAKMQPHDARGAVAASMRQASCCTVTVFGEAPARAQAAVDDCQTGSRSYAPPLVATVDAQPSVLAARVVAMTPLPRSTAPPDRGRDLFVRHCAFLL